MLVCHCLGISDRSIRAAIRSGAACRDSVAESCGAGSGCGGCLPAVDELIHEERSERSSIRSLPLLASYAAG